MTAVAAGIFSLVNPRKPGGDTGGSRKGIDVVIALDISRSMWAKDIAPNRLEKAKTIINDLIDKMPDNRIGLVLFAGKAYLQMPLTSDHSAAKLFVASADPTAIPQQGTVISDAMNMTDRAFNKQERKFKSVILFSDGEDHDPDALATAREMAARGVMINTVGIGTAEGTIITDPSTGMPALDAMGNRINSRLNASELMLIASLTNGIYVQINQTADPADQIIGHLSGVKKEALSDISLVNFKSYYLWFAIPMFLLILAEFFVPERKKLVIV